MTKSEIKEASEREKELVNKVIAELDKETRVPILRLKLTKAPVSIYSSKVGGTPYVPSKEAIPLDADGVPLRMLAQIDCKELAHLPEYPQTGLLQFWIAQRDDLGLDDEEGSRVVWYETVDKQITEEKVLEWLDELPETEDEYFEFPVYDEFGLSFTTDYECMSRHEHRYEDLFVEKYNELSNDNQIDDIDELSEETNKKVWELGDPFGHKMGGYPAFVQEDPRDDDDHTVLLLQIDSDDYDDEMAIMWGDNGVCGFYCTPDELKRRDFSNVVYNWDCL